MDRMTEAINMTGVAAGYRHAPVLRGVTCRVPPGEMAGVIGPNGAGKTTLLRVLTGLVRPTEGTVRLFGREVGDLPATERARLVGVVPQSVETPMAFTVNEIVTIGRTAGLSRWGRGSDADRRAVERAMVYTDTSDMKERLFSELSGGEKQRVVIAMVLAQEPKIILMDEATSHLDINHRIETMQIIERLNAEQGVTVLMVSHDLNLAAEFCRRLVLLDHGRIVSDGPPVNVLGEDILGHVYHCDVRVQHNQADGSVSVFPAPRLMPEHSGQGIGVHVIAGGGCGAEVLRRLSLAEYTLTCGVLNRGDSDAETCQALDIETALETPFSPVGREALAKARPMVAAADAVVVCGVPFGPGNLVNLDLAEGAARQGKRVLVRSGLAERDYTPGHEATRRLGRLQELGAMTWENVTDLSGMLPGRLAEGPCLKGRFPFRLGTTSYIIPAALLPNVTALAPRVDDVEILLFESDEISNLPSGETVAGLRGVGDERGLTFTVHLPIDIQLGERDETERRNSVEKCLRIIRCMQPLRPFGYTLHFHGDSDRLREATPSDHIEGWQAALRKSAAEILESGIDPALLCIETLSYPFELVEDLVSGLGLSICLDVGHLIMYGYDVGAYVEKYLSRTRIIHLHGVQTERDHLDISCLPDDLLPSLVRKLRDNAETERVATLEVFNQSDFLRSMEVMEKLAT
jgi:iron complex transport system ATP-binding protein